MQPYNTDDAAETTVVAVSILAGLHIIMDDAVPVQLKLRAHNRLRAAKDVARADRIAFAYSFAKLNGRHVLPFTESVVSNTPACPELPPLLVTRMTETMLGFVGTTDRVWRPLKGATNT